ncbi:HSP20-like chaperone [Crepidotus variabilis]|uniref:HSP20-like chaperone n=1 Tax=Crepidotus variabilis TaxID=179855 RepID=A0A9P6ENG5_9AGAR|nr:HSP20-like chaperone [Crepidotus variabilis]
MKIPPCTEIQGHSTAVVESLNASTAVSQSISQTVSTGTTADGKEVFRVGNTAPASEFLSSKNALLPPVDRPGPVAPVLEVDDLNTPVPVGTICRRKGCGVAFASDEVNRQGNGEGTICYFHPLPPIFREGSKGYLCCKRRVLEFDEFLKIKGCQTGRHCFISVVTETKTEEQVDCRMDHYQTPDQVHVSVFAKHVDKERSSVQFEDVKVILDLYLPSNKRFTRTIELFGPITPGESAFQFFGTKVELHLQKSDRRSWTVLEKTDSNLGNINLTFGVGGRTGTVGGKNLVLDETNKAR